MESGDKKERGVEYFSFLVVVLSVYRMIIMKFSDRQLFWVCFLEEILEFYGRLGGWSMNMARWPMADILVQRLKLELRVLDNGYTAVAAADYF